MEKLNNSKLEIFAGVYDGIQGSVPITQSINFYNKILSDLAVADKSSYVSESEKLNLLEFRKPIADYGKIGDREVCLMKEYKNIRITIFIGNHEMLPGYAFANLLE